MESFQPAFDKPSLRGAKLRSERASQHLQELAAIIDEFERRNPNPLVVRADRDALLKDDTLRDTTIDWSQSQRPPSGRLGIVAGEALYNLRAALDYLVFALAWLDSGRVQDNTQFPVADTPAKWAKQAKSRLRGVNGKHRGMIERYQPVRGCKWTATLQTLSNPDKHRTLAAVYSQFEGASQVHRENALPVPDDRTQVRIPVTGQTAGVYFWNDAPVVDTLGELTLEVGRVLVEFQGEFGESDELIIDGEEASP